MTAPGTPLLVETLNDLHDGIVLLDADGRIVFWNDWMSAASGRSCDETAGKMLDQVFPELAGGRLMSAIAWALNNGLPSLLSPSLNRHPLPLISEGRRIEQSVYVKALSRKGGATSPHCLVCISDVTALMEKERLLRTRTQQIGEELETFFNLIPEMACVASTDGHFLKINDNWQEVLGYTRQEILDTPIFDLIHPDDREGTMREVARQTAGKATLHFVNRYRCKDGSYRWLEWNAAPAIDGKLLFAAARDITESKRTETLLRESEQHFRTLANSGSALIWTSGPDKLCDYFNEPWLRFTGRTLEQELGNGWTKGVHPDDMGRCLDSYVTAFDQHKPFSVDYRLRHADGAYRWIRDDGTPRYDSDGKFIGYIGFCVDVTEQKEMAEELESHRCGLEKLVQKRTAELEREIGTRKKAEESLSALATSYADLSGKAFFEAVSRHIASVLGVDYVFVGKLSAMAHRIDVLGGYACGRAMESMSYQLADTPCDQVVGKSVCVYPENVQEQFPKDILLQQLDVHAYAGSPLFDKQRNPIGIMVVLHSQPFQNASAITEVCQVFSDRVAAEMLRSDAEEKLQQLNSELQQHISERTETLEIAKKERESAENANRAKGTFLAHMSHELRTPLNAILGFSDILGRDANLSESQRENLKIIHKSGNHLLGLINDILDITKIEAGRAVLEMATFNLDNMLSDIVDMMRLRADEKGVRLLIELPPEMPHYIVGDEAKLRQILINLISNAIKATAQGGVTLRLEMMRDRAGHLAIEVEDTGCGIAPEDQAKLFQPFVQIGQQGSQHGTGLGLTISRRFAELMGGALSLTSMVGRGSTFRVELPVQLGREEEVPQSVRMRGEVTGLEFGQTSYRVLVVDDQPDNRRLLGHLLESAGFQVGYAANGAEALEQFQQWKPDFIWMDRRMPVMDGEEATRRIRALPGGDKVKIATVTASTLKKEDDELHGAGFEAVIHKPYRSEQIFECMERLMELRFTRAKAGEAQAPVLSAAALAALAPALRTRLADALASLDSEHISEVINEIAQADPALGAGLRARVKNYDYAPILNIIKSLLPAAPKGAE